MRYLIVGDIHGNVTSLNKFVPLFDKFDAVIFCGDYVDRGESSIQVMETVLKVPNAIHLIGNHEISYIKKIKSGKTIVPKEENIKDFEKFKDLLLNVYKIGYDFYKDDNLSVSHAPAGLYQHEFNSIPNDIFYYGWVEGKDERGFPRRLKLKEKFPNHVSFKPTIYGHCHFKELNINTNEFCVDFDSGYGGDLAGAIFEDSIFKELILK